MLSRMIAASAGIALVCYLPVLPSIIVCIVIALFALCLLFHRYFFVLVSLSPAVVVGRWLVVSACFLFGVVWGCMFGHSLIKAQLPSALEGVPIWVEGYVVGLPQSFSMRGKQAQRFNFRTINAVCVSSDECLVGPRKFRLTWYEQTRVVPGQRWRLQIKAKRPWGMANPGGFDYQGWLIAQGIDGVGRVINGPVNELVDDNHWHIDRLRWQVASYIDSRQSLKQAALIKALLIGDKRDISSQQWDLFAATGTTHLMVISGLHVGLISALTFMLSRYLLLILAPHCAAERWAAVLSMVVALIYALAAGFSLPTQRALLMITVLMLTIYFRRHFAASQGLLGALLVCLIFDPLAPIGLSFWLSFAAVAVIFYGSVGRHHANESRLKYFVTQYLVFIGLIPVLAILLGQVSLLSPLANSLMIPLFSLLLVPFNLLAGILSLFSQSLGLWLWQGIDWVLVWCLDYLFWLQDIGKGALLYIPAQSVALQLLAIVAVLIVLSPRGLPLRWCGCFMLLPLFFLPAKRPAYGDLWLTVLDVGQGLSIVVQTQNQTLVYDVGAKMGDFSAAKSSLIPYLRGQGVNEVSTLVISHADNDHAGGLPALAQAMPINQLFYGQWIDHNITNASPCDDSINWQADGIEFRFLHPSGKSHNSAPVKSESSNNHSCVLSIGAESINFLLPGDIESEVELALIHKQQSLAATVLIAPHHGSHSSSSWPFIKLVSPESVVFSSGYRNQFSHPRPGIVSRYRSLGARSLVTSVSGAIEYKVEQGRLLIPNEYRLQNKRYWNSFE